MDNEQALRLLKRYNSGECTETEKALVEESFLAFNEQNTNVSFKKLERLKEETYKKLPKPNGNIMWLKIIGAASSAAAILAMGMYLFLPKSSNNIQSSLNMAETIVSAGNVAQITFSSGKVIELDKNKDEIKIAQSSITYIDGSKVDIPERNQEQTISTPRGGEYKIVLSDGTKVWLNAATELQYPTSFRESKARIVKLVSGEAYFEVAKDKKHPFTVISNNQILKVLGTHFNVNAYDKSIKTILLEGSVKLKSLSTTDSIRLVPGEKALNSENRFIKSDADLELEMAWKNGKIKFKDADLKSILTEAGRWYNIKVEYAGTIPNIHLTGGISRKSSLATLLKLLEMSGVNFSLNDKEGIKTLTIKS